MLIEQRKGSPGYSHGLDGGRNSARFISRGLTNRLTALRYKVRSAVGYYRLGLTLLA